MTLENTTIDRLNAIDNELTKMENKIEIEITNVKCKMKQLETSNENINLKLNALYNKIKQYIDE